MANDLNRIFDDVRTELVRQLHLQDQHQFTFTAGQDGLTSGERMLILVSQVGKLSAEAMADPSSGMMPVNFAGTFDFHRAGWGEREGGRSHRHSPIGTREGLRARLISVAAVALAWVAALDSSADAPSSPWKPKSAPSESAGAEAPPSAA